MKLFNLIKKFFNPAAAPANTAERLAAIAAEAKAEAKLFAMAKAEAEAEAKAIAKAEAEAKAKAEEERLRPLLRGILEEAADKAVEEILNMASREARRGGRALRLTYEVGLGGSEANMLSTEVDCTSYVLKGEKPVLLSLVAEATSEPNAVLEHWLQVSKIISEKLRKQGFKVDMRQGKIHYISW